MRHQIAALLLALSNLTNLNAQCNANTTNDLLTICANTPVTLGAFPYTPGAYTLLYDFNNALPAGWQSSGAVTFTSPCGPSSDTSAYFWAATSSGPPSITTNSINTSCGGEIIFDLMYVIQGGAAPCEGPDELDEGVLVQYSLDNGLNWEDIVYFVPDGSFAPHLINGNTSVANGPTAFTQWQTYSFPLPFGAISNNTLFRWIQPNSSGTCCDNWGLDNIKFNDNNCSNNIITWQNGSTQNTLTVTPTADTTVYFQVYDSLGVAQCTDSIQINILPSGYDNIVNLVNGNFVTGQDNPVVIHAENLGCQITSGTIYLVLDSLTTLNSAVPQPDFIHGDTLFWNYTNLSQPNGTPFIASLSLHTSTSAMVGDMIHLDLRIDDTLNDQDPSNNIKHYIFPVLNGYDPNDKRVYPIGDCLPHFVYNDQKLTYTVRFQNTGNSNAFTIKVIDSLSPYIKKESLKILGSSDPVSVHFDGNNILRFNFDTINLPPAMLITSDPNSSIGYVIFEFEQVPNTTFGSEIKNKAEIYFDFNPKIVTNEVFNTVTDGRHISSGDTLVILTLNDSITWNNQTYSQSGIYAYHETNQYGCDSVSYLDLTFTSLGIQEHVFDFSIHPNPSNGKITIETTSLETFELSVFSMDGKPILSTTLTGSSEIDLSDLAAGTYFISCQLNGSKATKRMTIN